jgi:hypothetical protein
MPKIAPRDQLAAQASGATGTEEKKKKLSNETETARLLSAGGLFSPIPGRLVSFVMTRVKLGHPTFQPTASTKGILTRNCIW